MDQTLLGEISQNRYALQDWTNINMFLFVRDAYDYYVAGGWSSICIGGTLRILSRILSTILFVLLFGSYNWSCIRSVETMTLSECLIPPSPYTLLFSFIPLLFLILYEMHKISRLKTVHLFYKNTLQFSDDALCKVPWSSIVLRWKERAPISNFSNTSLDAFANTLSAGILQYEHMFMALFDNSSPIEWENITKRGDILFAYIRYFVFPNIYESVSSIKKYIRLTLILYCVFLPFIFACKIFLVFISFMERWHEERNFIFSRRVSLAGKYRIQEWCELNHLFEKRLSTAIPLVNSYVNLSPRPLILRSFGKLISENASIVLTWFILLSALSKSLSTRWILLATCIGWIFLMGRNMLPTTSHRDISNIKSKIVLQLRYIPSRNGNELLTFFPTQFTFYFYEILSVLLLPYDIITVIYPRILPIHRFFKAYTDTIPVYGRVMKASLFTANHENIGVDNARLSQSIRMFEASQHTERLRNITDSVLNDVRMRLQEAP